MAVTIRLFAMYELTADGTGATGLTVTVDVDKYAKSDGTRTNVVTGGSATAGANGIYHYAVASVTDMATHDYIAVFKTAATTVKTKHFAFLLQDLIAAATQIMTNLDVIVSSRNATTPPTVDAIANQVWDEALAGHVVAGSTAVALSAAGSAADPLLSAVPGAYLPGTAGEALGSFTAARAAKLDLIGAGVLTVVSPVTATGNVGLMLGDDYLLADGRALLFTVTGYPVLTGGAIAMRVRKATVISLPGVVTGAAACYVEVTKTQLATIGAGVYTYDLQATLVGGSVVTLGQSQLVVTGDV